MTRNIILYTNSAPTFHSTSKCTHLAHKFMTPDEKKKSLNAVGIRKDNQHFGQRKNWVGSNWPFTDDGLLAIIIAILISDTTTHVTTPSTRVVLMREMTTTLNAMSDASSYYAFTKILVIYCFHSGALWAKKSTWLMDPLWTWLNMLLADLAKTKPS